MMQFSSDKDIVVFDLDDTLYKEYDYLVSAYRKIEEILGFPVADEMLNWWKNKDNVFQCLIDKYKPVLTMGELLDIYRYHKPDISLSNDAAKLLDTLCNSSVKVGIITDGRSITQRNKINALGLHWIEDVIISEEFGSEKPNEDNYRYFMDKYPEYRYTYIADNIKKDFIAPNNLGWQTVCLMDDGRNIHKQNINDVDSMCLPQIMVHSLTEIINNTTLV